jgi:three-Cys-motif partner protein
VADEVIRRDPTDGLPAPPVGEWAREKHELLRLYIEITRSTRRKYVDTPRKAGATFIDLYSGAGRAYIRGTDQFIDGSPLVAWKASQVGGYPFSDLYVSDAEPLMLDAAVTRLRMLGAPAHQLAGPSLEAARRLAGTLNPHALHFVLLDPFALDLPFDLIRVLAAFKRIDSCVGHGASAKLAPILASRDVYPGYLCAGLAGIGRSAAE